MVTAVRHHPEDVINVVGLLRRQTTTADLELIVVDNRPAHRLDRLLVPDHGPSLHISVLRERRAGLSIARNRGISAARGEYVAITDPDVQPDPAWIERLVRASSETGAFCVGGSYTTVYPGGAVIPLTSELRECHGPLRWPDRRVRCAWPYWISGCNMLFHRQTALSLGLFRTDLGRKGRRLLGCEDLEFVQRAAQAGHAALIEPAAHVVHPVRRPCTSARWFLFQGIGHGISVARMEMTTTVPAAAIRTRKADLTGALQTLLHSFAPLDRGRVVEAARNLLRIIAYHAERRRLRVMRRGQTTSPALSQLEA